METPAPVPPSSMVSKDRVSTDAFLLPAMLQLGRGKAVSCALEAMFSVLMTFQKAHRVVRIRNAFCKQKNFRRVQQGS